MLRGGVKVKCFWQQMVCSVLAYRDRDLMENEFQQFEDDLHQMLEVKT